MRYNSLLFALFFTAATAMAQPVTYSTALSSKQATLAINYLSNFPYFYKKSNDSLTGIEYDILLAFKKWVKENKGISLSFDFQEKKNFADVYTNVKEGKASIGAATVTITDDRKKEVGFSDAYLKNQSLMIVNGKLTTLDDLNQIAVKFDTMIAVTVKNSIHEKILNNIKQQHFPAMKIVYADSPVKVVEMIAANPKYYGYVDMISYWAYLRRTPKVFLKINSVGNNSEENFGFIMPAGSDWQQVFGEFMQSGFGFGASEEYRRILEKHLTYEVINSVSIARR